MSSDSAFEGGRGDFRDHKGGLEKAAYTSWPLCTIS